MSSIFMLKQVIDYAHAEIAKCMAENEELKKRIAELEKKTGRPPIIVEPKNEIIVNDAEFKEAAMDFVEVHVENKTDEKQIVVQKTKERKDYQREYQKLYRQKKKDVQ
jgi:replication fork clamp-binding protein CrfC